MTLPASGAISLGDVNTELGLSATAQIGMNDAAVRELFGIAAGAIDLNTGHGRARVGIVAGLYFDGATDYIGYDTTLPIGSISPATYGAYTIDILAMAKAHGGAFQEFYVFFSAASVPQNAFSSVTINGQTYNSASAAYTANVFGRTRWLWTTPDPSLVDTTAYNAIFAP